MRIAYAVHCLCCVIGTLFLAITASQAAVEKIDFDTVERIKTEAMEHSQVMELASWLTDVYGPRLTGSPITTAAADWAMATIRSWGISNVQVERWTPPLTSLAGGRWDPRDRSWMNEQFTFRAVKPYPLNIIAVPATWSPSTNGRIKGPAIRVDAGSLAELKRFGGKLKGAFPPHGCAGETPPHFVPQAHRLTDSELEMFEAGSAAPLSFVVHEHRYDALNDPAARRWLHREGVVALLFTAPGDGGTIAQHGTGSVGFANKNIPDQIPIVKVSAESYGRIVRILQKNLPVTLELEMQNSFYDEPDLFNVIAEIPGTDPKLKEEVVMFGAHLDSWTYGTGATDDAAGVAVTMETMRILKKLDLRPRRTIRCVLWTGHEQGAIGSSCYIKQHFLREDSKGSISTTSEYDKFSVFFRSGGYGKIRGILQGGNVAVGPIFDAWMEPFKDMGMKTTSILDRGTHDYTMFQKVGLPAFGFMWDPIEFGTRTHHTSADVYERLQAEDMKFNAAVTASFVWHAALRDDKIPRMPRQR